MFESVELSIRQFFVSTSQFFVQSVLSHQYVFGSDIQQE